MLINAFKGCCWKCTLVSGLGVMSTIMKVLPLLMFRLALLEQDSESSPTPTNKILAVNSDWSRVPGMSSTSSRGKHGDLTMDYIAKWVLFDEWMEMSLCRRDVNWQHVLQPKAQCRLPQNCCCSLHKTQRPSSYPAIYSRVSAITIKTTAVLEKLVGICTEPTANPHIVKRDQHKCLFFVVACLNRSHTTFR